MAKTSFKRDRTIHARLQKLPDAAIKIPYRIIFENQEIDSGISRPPLLEICRKYEAKVVDAYIGKNHEIVYLLERR